MTPEELHKDWRNYVWERWNKRRLFQVVLKERYRKCGLVKIGKKRKMPVLIFHNRHDDGSWANNPTILRCDKDGNCYLYTFGAKNINEYKWKKCGRFVKLSATSK